MLYCSDKRMVVVLCGGSFFRYQTQEKEKKKQGNSDRVIIGRSEPPFSYKKTLSFCISKGGIWCYTVGVQSCKKL